jgi:hypothetical protein
MGQGARRSGKTIMNRLMSLFTVLVALCASESHALDLRAYQTADGAITVHPHGDHVDPYFAMKALWASRQLGDPAVSETRAWINWLLPRQRPDGRFARYCEQTSAWEACEQPDADDSLLAMWIELLYEASPHRMPPDWMKSADMAKKALDALRMPGKGVYRIGPDTHEALLMDNVEVYESLRRVAHLKKLAKDRAGARHYLKQAHDLRMAMHKIFRPDEAGLLHWSSADNSTSTFYPYAVADLYPWLHGMNTHGFGRMSDWNDWLNRYGERWLNMSDDDYPWGLVAMLALREQSYPVVQRWVANANAIRGGEHWDVLEEAVLQGLEKTGEHGNE